MKYLVIENETSIYFVDKIDFQLDATQKSGEAVIVDMEAKKVRNLYNGWVDIDYRSKDSLGMYVIPEGTKVKNIRTGVIRYVDQHSDDHHFIDTGKNSGIHHKHSYLYRDFKPEND